MDYDKAYNEWDELTVNERIDWCKNNDISISREEASKDSFSLSEEYYCLWTTIREILMEEY